MNDFMLRRVKSFHIYANDTQSRKHNKGNLIDLISERFSGIDYRRKSETKLRGVIVRNVGNIDKFSNKLRLTAKDHYGWDNIGATYRKTSKRR